MSYSYSDLQAHNALANRSTDAVEFIMERLHCRDVYREFERKGGRVDKVRMQLDELHCRMLALNKTQAQIRLMLEEEADRLLKM